MFVPAGPYFCGQSYTEPLREDDKVYVTFKLDTQDWFPLEDGAVLPWHPMLVPTGRWSGTTVTIHHGVICEQLLLTNILFTSL